MGKTLILTKTKPPDEHLNPPYDTIQMKQEGQVLGKSINIHPKKGKSIAKRLYKGKQTWGGRGQKNIFHNKMLYGEMQ